MRHIPGFSYRDSYISYLSYLFSSVGDLFCMFIFISTEDVHIPMLVYLPYYGFNSIL